VLDVDMKLHSQSQRVAVVRERVPVLVASWCAMPFEPHTLCCGEIVGPVIDFFSGAMPLHI
jgi:hypothetical protein